MFQKNYNKIFITTLIIFGFVFLILSSKLLVGGGKADLTNPEEKQENLERNQVENLVVKDENNLPKEKESVKNIPHVYLEILNERYSTNYYPGDSVYQVMERLKEDENQSFSFKTKKYPGLGIFVNEINGSQGKSGAYWIYYVNGEEAKVGVSNYILNPGDIITWKQE